MKGDPPIRGDGDPRAEDFFVNLLSAAGATLSPGTTGKATIVDDDDPAYDLVAAPDVTEGTGRTPVVLLNFKVKLSRTSAQQVQVTALTQDDTALSTSDYKFLSKPIIWNGEYADRSA